MKPLGNSYRKNGFNYTIIKRVGDVAIAAQRLGERTSGTPMAYEVIKVRPCPDAYFTDPATKQKTLVPAHETAPGNEEWGTRGWTFPTIDRAEAKFADLVLAQAQSTAKT